MKKVILTLGLFAISSTGAFAQYNTDWYFPSTSNAAPAGYIGIGTKTTTTAVNTPLPSYNLHVHGTADYISSNLFNGLNQNNGGNTTATSLAKASINYGVTSRIGLTNTMTGKSDMEGAVLQMSQLEFMLKNQAQGDMLISVPNLQFRLSNSTRRAWLGNTVNSAVAGSSTYAKSNVISSDNGIYIQTNNTLRYGLKVKVPINSSRAIEVYGNDATTKNFLVNGGGEVYARKYTTTLNTIPDYVFFSGYDLMPLHELRNYVQTNHHLPNIPSAEEMTSAPVDLGEMNRLLLEKVEELTLYVLELEDRLNKVEQEKE